MINVYDFQDNMKKLLYFLIGLLISFSFFRIGYAYAYDDPIEGNVYAGWGDFATTLQGIPNILGNIDPNDVNLNQNCVYWQIPSSNSYGGYYPGGYNETYGTKIYENSIRITVVSGNAFYYYLVSKVSQSCESTDTDGDGIFDNLDSEPNIPTQTQDADNDGIPDKFDLNPNSSEPYNAAIVSVCYDENHKVVAGIIQDDKGNQYTFGTMPTDFEGYTIESVSGDLITYQSGGDLSSSLGKLDINDLNLTKKNSPVEIQTDGTIIPGSSSPFSDYRKFEDDQTTAKQPDTQQAPSQLPDSSDVDSGRFDKIISNTSSTNTNLENIQKYLGITNDYLAKINDKSIETTVTSIGAPIVSVDTPTADEIGQSVKDKLIDSGQTIDTTITDNIPTLDKTDTLTSVKTKYSDRYDLFITTLKGSDLFSLPFGIFSGPSGSGSSIQTVNIGKWGSSTDQTATVDYSNYDSVWDLLRSVLLLLTSFSCFKILVLKKG